MRHEYHKIHLFSGYSAVFIILKEITYFLPCLPQEVPHYLIGHSIPTLQ